MSTHPKEAVVDYTNRLGLRMEYTVRPITMVFSAIEEGAPKEWLMQVIDISDKKVHHLRMSQLHSWRPA